MKGLGLEQHVHPKGAGIKRGREGCVRRRYLTIHSNKGRAGIIKTAAQHGQRATAHQQRAHLECFSLTFSDEHRSLALVLLTPANNKHTDAEDSVQRTELSLKQNQYVQVLDDRFVRRSPRFMFYVHGRTAEARLSTYVKGRFPGAGPSLLPLEVEHPMVSTPPLLLSRHPRRNQKGAPQGCKGRGGPEPIYVTIPNQTIELR